MAFDSVLTYIQTSVLPLERNCLKWKNKAFIGIRFSVKYSQYKNTNFGYGCDEMPKKSSQKEAMDSFVKSAFASRLRKAKAYRNMTNKEIVKHNKGDILRYEYRTDIHMA